METNIEKKSQPLKSGGAAAAMAQAISADARVMSDKVSDAAHAVREQVEGRTAEVINQAKQKASEAYQQANKRVSEQYEKAVDYGHENPGKTTLLVFGTGIGIGLLLKSFFGIFRKRVASQ